MKTAQDYYRYALIISAVISVIFTVAGIIFCRPISDLLSGGGELSEQVYSYCIVTFIGSGASVMIYIPFAYLQLEGKNKAISISVLIMFITDVALDVLFLFVFDFGLYGASAASVISALAAAVFGFVSLAGKGSNYRAGPVRLRFRRLRRIIRFGSPAALGNLFDAVKLLALNMIILTVAGEKGAAVWAVLNTFSELSLMIVNGVPRAAAPMISAYYTAKENGGIRILTALEARTGLLLSTIYAVIITALNVPLAMLFGISSSLLVPFICLGSGVVITTLCVVWEKHFNAIGMIAEANVAAGARCCVLPVAAAVLLSVSELPLWLFLPVSAAATAVVIAVMTSVNAARSRRTDRPLSGALLLDDFLEREHRILDFSIAADMDEACDAAEKIKDFCAENDMDMKMTIKLGLAIEELLNVIIQKTSGITSVDLRAFALQGSTGIRIRCAGKNYDPFTDKDSDEDFLMGINMIHKMAEATTHIYTLGMNIVTIIFPDKKG
jgi:Na+-driven multidrug efflux pump